MGRELHGGVQQFVGGAGDVESRDDAILLGDDLAAHGRFGRDDGEGGRVASADVFGEGALDGVEDSGGKHGMIIPTKIWPCALLAKALQVMLDEVAGR